MWDIMILQVVVLLCGTTVFVTSMRFLRRYLELKQERSLRAPDSGLTDRLERIEATVETTALEVERISEAHRFMAKLLADRGVSTRTPAKLERVITPH